MARTSESGSVAHVLLSMAAVLLLFVVGCSGSEGSAVATVLRDSAGVVIVENSADPIPESGWHVSTAPRVSVGVLDGAEEYQLNQVTGALRFDDGTIVVANAGSNEIRFYDAEGRHTRSVGRDGEGPGEFRSLGELHRLAGDSVMATDRSLSRISLFDRDRRFVRSFQLQAPADNMLPRPVGPLGGRLLVTSSPGFDPGLAAGVHYDAVPYLRYSMNGEPFDTLGSFPGTETYVRTEGRGIYLTNLAFGRSTQARVSGTRLYLATQSDYQISVHGEDGSLDQIIRLEHRPQLVADADIQRLREQRLGTMDEGDMRRRYEQVLRDMPMPERMPAHGAIQVDVQDNIWVQEYRPEGQDGPETWIVFDGEGRLIGSVRTPERFRIQEIGADYVLGVHTDDFDVEYLHLYTLTKS